MIEMIFIVVPASSIIIAIVALYYALKRTSYAEESLKVQKKMLRESRKYWRSWKERAKDVSRRVLEQMTEEELERELIKKRIERERKQKSK